MVILVQRASGRSRLDAFGRHLDGRESHQPIERRSVLRPGLHGDFHLMQVGVEIVDSTFFFQQPPVGTSDDFVNYPKCFEFLLGILVLGCQSPQILTANLHHRVMK